MWFAFLIVAFVAGLYIGALVKDVYKSKKICRECRRTVSDPTLKGWA